MKIDTEIRHVTKPGANLFLELGFPPEEAKRLHLASQKQINDTKQLKEQLMAELAAWIVGTSRPALYDVPSRGHAKVSPRLSNPRNRRPI